MLLYWPAATAAAMRVNVVLYIAAVVACGKEKEGHDNIACTQFTHSLHAQVPRGYIKGVSR